ncbi:MAG: translation initiation factor IF-2 [Gemmatimonadetes bacterium]|nr:translation initiation factor IF-2 [Gemmatimonadota bacterium]
MSKLRVSDMATEFGIGADEVIGLLKAMEVTVRTPATPLPEDVIARVRARWEVEKRKRSQKPAAPAAASRRRKTAAPEAPAAPAPRAATAAAEAPKAPAKKKVPAKKAEAPAPAPAPAPAAPAKVVRRKKADLVQPEPEPLPEPEPVVAEPAVAATSVAEPAAPAAPAESPRAPVVTADAPPPAPPRASAVPSTPPSEGYSSGGHPSDLRPRPRPIVPGAPRPRPAASGLPFPPRPVASAAPGGMAAPRRDDKRPGGGAPAGGMGGGMGAGARRKKGKRGAVDQEAVSANITKTMREMRGGTGRGARRVDGRIDREELEAMRAADAERERTTVRVNEFITVSELAQILKIPATQIVGFAFKNLGLMVTINQRLDFDQIELIASEFGFAAVKEEEYAAAAEETAAADAPESLKPRPPVVTIMGHVDHGKTSLLDYIRKATVVAGEAGGITQHIGAYHVTLPGGKHITFLDTPGHQAFTAMRARGAQVTDIVVLVVAADDSVMPQTIEAISHARNAGVPIIVAINKIDLPTANPEKIKQDLLQHEVVLEQFGGKVLATEISARKGTGVGDLLDQILLQAEILDLKANPDRGATGSVVEAQLDAGKGPVATVLVQNGTLAVGNDFICGLFSGRVRALLDERGKPVKAAGPAVPVQVLGLTGVPTAGDQFIVVEDSVAARDIAQRRERLDREARSRRTSKGVVSLEDFMSQSAAGARRTLKLLIKADQGGPAEALADALAQLTTPEVSVEVVQRSVGAITEGDILLAKASGAIIIGFHVRPDNKARAAAEREGVDIKLYKIIYEAVADVRAALEGMLRPDQREVILGEAEVREIFKVARVGTIAGCSVRSGIIVRQGARVRVLRDGKEIYEGNLASLRRFKDDVKEVREGFECGIGVENFNDVKVGDVIECFKTEIVARTLQPTAEA